MKEDHEVIIEKIIKAYEDSIIFGVGYISIDEKSNVKHIPYLDTLKEKEEDE